MDTEKLLKLLVDIVEYDAQVNVRGILSELNGNLSQNTAEAFKTAEDLRKDLSKKLHASPTNNLTPSQYSMLSSLKANRFVGIGAQVEIERLFVGSPLTITERVAAYSAEYNQFLERSSQLRSALETMGFKPYEAGTFQVGVSIPTAETDLNAVLDHLKHWNLFLHTCAEIVGESEPVEVVRASNGSIELFVGTTVMVAKIADTVLNHITDLYKKLKDIEKVQKEIDGIDLDNELKRSMLAGMQQGEQDLKDKCVSEARIEVFTHHRDGNGVGRERAELESHFETAFNLVLKDIQEGVKVEVLPPAIEARTTTEEKQLGKAVASANPELRELYDRPPEARILPFSIKITKTEINKLEKTLEEIPEAPATSDVADTAAVVDDPTATS